MFQATAIVNSGLLLMAVMGLLFPAVLHFTHTELHFGKSQLALSRFSSCIMLVAYASYLFFQLKSQPNLYRSVSEVDCLILAVWFCLGSLLLFHCILFFSGVIKCLIWRLKGAHISNSSWDDLYQNMWLLFFVTGNDLVDLIVSPICKQDGEHNSEDSEEEEAPEITQWEAIGWLAVLTTWISVLSGYLVDAIEVIYLPFSFSFLFSFLSVKVSLFYIPVL